MVEVFELEEVVDAILCFLTQTNAELDHITLKNYFLQNVCGLPHVNCTRNSAYVFDHIMDREDGEEIGCLAILENQEPTNIVYQWSKTQDLEKGCMLDIIDTVCEE